MRKLSLMSKMGVLFLTWRQAHQRELVPHKITLKLDAILTKVLSNLIDQMNASQ